ncbi:MFS transporter [Longispora fulva]|uniref:DHA2 family multidrug resistance protein-like MFS transporter n=1 Tax=Longispora fulva TaxID=619741 RepID=A0A8J7KHM9_9ACTN|nr:MFS transporter [Longispora fulva]MBG6138735.1 DHA2 family multidrug resistance protein-like MFS transporter [Longispora fulva]GIG58229.1 MFS transporter [Longispora fulva]
MSISPARKWATLVVCCLAGLVLAIDMTALHLAIPGLIRDLDPTATQILWIADAYGFALAGLLVTMGGLGDRIGRKRLLLIGMAAFAAASAATAYAASPELLIAARALLGVAGATIMPSTLSIVRNVFTDPKERTAAVGISTGVVGAGIGLGPVLGGAVLDHFWWGSVFLINVPIMAAILLAAVFVLPESRDPRPGRLDVPSVPLSIVGVLGVVYAITESTHGGVTQPKVLVALGIGLVGLALFVRRQSRLAEPLIDVRLFRRAAFSGSIGANLFAMFAMVAQSLIFAQYFQLVLGWSPWQAGLAGLPGALAAMTGGALAAPLITAMGRARVVALGMAICAAGFVLYVLVTGADGGYLPMLGAMVPSGFGMGMALTVTSDTILASVSKDRAGAASAISETATELGGALGMAVLGSVLNAAYRGSLDLPAGLPAGAVDGVRDSLGGAMQVARGLPEQLAGQVVRAAQGAFLDGMHVALYCSAGMAALVALAALVTLRSVPKVIEETPADAGPAETLVPARQ